MNIVPLVVDLLIVIVTLLERHSSRSDTLAALAGLLERHSSRSPAFLAPCLLERHSSCSVTSADVVLSILKQLTSI